MASSDERTRARLELLEWEARTHPRRHALRLTAMVMLGYAYPLALLTLSFAVVVLLLSLGPLAWRQESGVFFWWCVGVLLALGFAAAVLGTFRLDIPEPDGHRLRPGEAPQLGALVDDVCAAAGGGIPIHHILIDFSFNAAACQRRRFALFGSATNYLILGLPMLIALNPQQLKSVIAHELGHFHGQHSAFGAWVYRVFQTWQSLAGPVRASGRVRRAVVGWFVRWYGPKFATTTLALRRVHEYAADRSAADYSGQIQTAEALLEIDCTAYRLEKGFWPHVFRGAYRGEPIPPGDLFQRMVEFLNGPISADMMRRWKARELAARTPVTADHPCLKDRLTALGFAHMLENAPVEIEPRSAGGALELLGECREHVWAVCSASWKAVTIQQWRTEHGIVKHLRETAEKKKATTQPPEDPDKRGEWEWELLEPQIHADSPDNAISRLHEFIAQYPKVAAAHYALGQILLRQDDESAAQSLERAMANGSEYINPALNLLLDYYRETGRDADADPIRKRLLEHERLTNLAKKERLKVTRRDRFLPHGLSPEELQKVRVVLHRYPQVTAAYVVQKQLKLFADKPSYVVAVRRRARAMEDQRRMDKALVSSLASELPIPCAVVIVGWTSPRLYRRIAAACPEPVFISHD